jgi:hypothetical protein
MAGKLRPPVGQRRAPTLPLPDPPPLAPPPPAPQAAAKRFKVTGSGKIMARHAGKQVRGREVGGGGRA